MSEFAWGFRRVHALPPIDQLKLRLAYAPETGAFTWKTVPPGGERRINQPAGSNVSGYKTVRVDGAAIKLHRLAWALMTGEWPTTNIDHINGDSTDNRWSNLRAAPGGVNQQNIRKANAKSKTGVLGVGGVGNKFKATIRVSGKTLYIGTFVTPEEAHAAYVEAKRRLHPGCTL